MICSNIGRNASILFHPIVYTVYVLKMDAIAIIHTSPHVIVIFFCYDIDIVSQLLQLMICRHCIYYNPLGLLRIQFAIYLYFEIYIL